MSNKERRLYHIHQTLSETVWANSLADNNLFSQYQFANILEILSSTEQNVIEALIICMEISVWQGHSWKPILNGCDLLKAMISNLIYFMGSETLLKIIQSVKMHSKTPPYRQKNQVTKNISTI